MPKIEPKTEAGSTTIEAVISLTALTIVISGFAIAGYTGFARLWIQRSSYEAVICLASKENENVCRERMKERITEVLPSVEVRRARLTRSAHLAFVQFEAELMRGLTMRESRSLSLPIRLARRDK